MEEKNTVQICDFDKLAAFLIMHIWEIYISFA